MNSNYSKETSSQFGYVIITFMFTMLAILFVAYGDSSTQKQAPTMHQSTVQRLAL